MPSSNIEPYLFFAGRCEEALDFYRTAVGAQVDFSMKYKDSPEPQPPGTVPPGFEDKIMHALFRVGSSTLMASDGCGEEPGFKGFSLTLNVPDEAEAHRAFDALKDGGEATMPLTKTFYSPCFGMLTDKFGMGWMIMVPGEAPK